MFARALVMCSVFAITLGAAERQPTGTRTLRFTEVLEKAVARARAEDARIEMANGNIKLLEAMGKWRVELRPSLGLLAFSNPLFLAANVGSGMLINRRTAPTANALEGARFDVLAAEVQAETLRVRTRIEAAHCYFDLLAKQQMTEQASDLLASRRKAGKQVDAMVRAARISAVERLSYEQEVLDLESQWLDAETARKGAAIRLSQLMGMENPTGQIRVENVSMENFAKLDGEGSGRPAAGQFFQKAMVNRAEIRLLQEKIATLDRQRQKEKAGLTVSLRDTGEKKAQDQLHAARIKVLELELRSLEDTIRGEVAALENELGANSERLKIATRRLDLARQSHQVMEARLEGGLADPASRAFSEQRVLAAHWMETRADNDRKASMFTLLTIAGLDTESQGRTSAMSAAGGQD